VPATSPNTSSVKRGTGRACKVVGQQTGEARLLGPYEYQGVDKPGRQRRWQQAWR
jgi:hypothetical protein